MKETSLLITIIILLTVSIILTNSCNVEIDKKEYLKVVLENVKKIESATYFSIRSGYAPFDTLPYSTQHNYFKEFKNPSDTFVGAKFVTLNELDTTKIDYCYDGNMRARVNWDEKTMEIDSFRNNPFPFRVVNAPFFTRAIRLLEYTLTTKDSLTIDTKNYRDSIHYCITVYDTVVEFGFSRISYPPAIYGSYKGSISKYDIWINKSNNLPYRVTRDLPHDKTIEECKIIVINKGNPLEFVASKYFPDFPLKSEVQETKAKNDLLGRVAPDWILNDSDYKTVALKDFKSKVLMIQFTSVSCGPCMMSISFLKKLKTEYNKKDFDFVAIEGFNRNSRVLKKYQERNLFNYKFLMSTNEVTNNYNIKAVPVFYILDENRVIRKIINGYGLETTDKEIRDGIDELIK